MTDYVFRIRAQLSRNRFIDCNASELQVSIVGRKQTIRIDAAGAKEIAKCHTLDFVQDGYADEEDARAAGLQLQYALILAGASSLIGIRYENIDSERSVGELKRVREGENAFGPEKVPYGLSVYEGELDRGLSFNDERLLCFTPVHNFLKDLAKAWTGEYDLSDKNKLALELYSASHFETSQASKLLTLVTVIEALSVRSDRETSERALLKRCIKLAKEEGYRDLASTIGGLKKQSIKKSCQKLVRSFLGDEQSILMGEIYDVRSDLVHDGIVPNGSNLDETLFDAEKLVFQVLWKKFVPK